MSIKNLASLWIGDSLGVIEQASIRSILNHHGKLILYSYEPILRVPEGVEQRDAREIFSGDTIIKHKKNNSPALHADLFRYALMAKTDSIWVDLDIIALKPLIFDSDWVFGIETEGEANNAVLRLPKDSKTLNGLLELQADTVGLPPTLTGMRRLKYWLKSFGQGLTIDRWPWGATGPRLLTYYLKKYDEFKYAMPVEAFYSIPFEQAHRFAIPGEIRREDLPKEAFAVHLWGKELRSYIENECGGRVLEGSFLQQCLED